MPDYCLGIDLHKRSSVWVIINKNKKVLFSRSVKVHPDAFASTLTALPVPCAKLQVALEPVCGWRWVVDQLESVGMDVHVANPRKVKLIADSRLKCDRIDATILAELLMVGYLPESYRAPEDVQKLRALVRERQYLVELQTGVKNRIQGVLTRQGLHMLPCNPTSSLGKALILASAEEELKRSTQFLFKVAESIKPLDQEIEARIAHDTVAQLLMTMPGIGVISAATIRAEVGDFARFQSPQALASFAGIVPSQRSSGTSQRFGRITKVGSKYLRYVLVEAAYRIRTPRVGVDLARTPKSNTVPLVAFLQKRKELCSASSARVALAHRMLTILWYMVKNNQPYQPDFSLRTVK
jgi:transposase